jgi:hypothetical protein
LARTSATLWRDSTSASNSAQNNAKNKSSCRLKNQNKGTESYSLMQRWSDSVRCEWATTASSSSEVTTALTVANSYRASWSGVGTSQDTACWACMYPDVEMTLGLRRRRWEGTPSPSPSVPTHEPLEESSCSIAMAKVAKKDRKQGWRIGDSRVEHHDSGYKGPRGGLSTPVAFNTSPIR